MNIQEAQEKAKELGHCLCHLQLPCPCPNYEETKCCNCAGQCEND